MVDRLNAAVGKATIWLVLIVVVISAGNAVVRYGFDWSSNALLEIQWYLFSAIFLLCAGYVLKKNEHIRIDVIFGRFSARTQNWIDVFGFLAFFLPMVALTLWLSWPVFMNAWNSGEMSANPGGLVRWPVRLLLPVGFLLLLRQGVSGWPGISSLTLVYVGPAALSSMYDPGGVRLTECLRGDPGSVSSGL